jgi:glutathione synthase/RimK-type ligase-like ATP-grasp enzyme
MSNKVLILSSTDDKHAEKVADLLGTAGAHVDFLKLNDLIETAKLTFEIGMGSGLCTLEKERSNLDFNSYFSIWYRRPGVVRAPQFVEPWIGKMVESEARSAVDGIFRSLNCLWVNEPAANVACADKLWQLQIANELGFRIPETLVTNKPDLVVEFFDKCDGQVIYKLMGELTNSAIPANENPRGVSTLPLRKEDLPFVEQVSFSPHMFQRCVQKSYDLRVTVVGTEIFGTRIDSQSGRGKIDWRHDYSVAIESFDLPAQISDRCIDLTRKLGLNYGAIDLILTPEGEYIFLEINCAGQFMWIEERTQQSISLSLARLLNGLSEPLVKKNCL